MSSAAERRPTVVAFAASGYKPLLVSCVCVRRKVSAKHIECDINSAGDLSVSMVENTPGWDDAFDERPAARGGVSRCVGGGGRLPSGSDGWRRRRQRSVVDGGATSTTQRRVPSRSRRRSVDRETPQRLDRQRRGRSRRWWRDESNDRIGIRRPVATSRKVRITTASPDCYYTV